MKKAFLIIFIVLAGLIAVGFGGITYLQKDMKVVEDLNIDQIDLSSIEDGTYVGTYEQGRFTNTVEVVISNHEIISITIVDTLTFEKEDVTQLLIDQVIEGQSLDVDGVAGASLSVNAYLKAIEIALKG